jgi:catechol 2,3-dioxygenase-like lactoylglutathione lyase family enzyme
MSTITAPVARMLGATDTQATAAFYRDVLGFEIRESDGVVEAVSGPARLAFGRHDFAPGDWDHPQPPGTAIVFFETDDLAAMHAAIASRGGRPSKIQRVNTIALAMFSVRDPDGRVLWFGKSDDRPHGPHEGRMLEKALPELPFDDVPGAVAYYRDVLGFTINYQQDDLGVMDRDEVTLLLIQRTTRHSGIGSAEFYVENADRLHAELRAKGAVVEREPVSHPWGLRDFIVRDIEGNRLTFAQPFE